VGNNNGKGLKFDRRDRNLSWQMTEKMQAGVLNTAAATDQQPAVGSHPAVGELLAIPRKDMQAVLLQFFTTLVFLREMLEQLKAIEKKHGESAADLIGPKEYAGLPIPPQAKGLEIDDDTLYAVVEVPSSIVPNVMVPARMAVAKVGLDLGNKIVVTTELLQRAKQAWETEHRAAEPGESQEGG